MDKIKNYFNSRSSGIPMQYLIGSIDYLGLKLNVSSPVLIPRQETEQICEWIIYLFNNSKLNKINKFWPETVPIQYSSIIQSTIPPTKSNGKPFKILDLCTGSGNIALSLSAYIPYTETVGLDINPQAIQLANKNKIAVQNQITQKTKPNLNNSIHCEFVEGDLLELHKVKGFNNYLNSFDLIVSNPPYISGHEYNNLQIEIKDFEDSRALIAAENGMQFYYEIINQANNLLIPLEKKSEKQGNYCLPELIMELGCEWQSISINQKLKEFGFNRIELFSDWNGRKRWIAASRINSTQD
jgi:release factor glutamine methyltransferase